jgi:hypothetical protein
VPLNGRCRLCCSAARLDSFDPNSRRIMHRSQVEGDQHYGVRFAIAASIAGSTFAISSASARIDSSARSVMMRAPAVSCAGANSASSAACSLSVKLVATAAGPKFATIGP